MCPNRSIHWSLFFFIVSHSGNKTIFFKYLTLVTRSCQDKSLKRLAERHVASLLSHLCIFLPCFLSGLFECCRLGADQKNHSNALCEGTAGAEEKRPDRVTRRVSAVVQWECQRHSRLAHYVNQSAQRGLGELRRDASILKGFPAPKFNHFEVQHHNFFPGKKLKTPSDHSYYWNHDFLIVYFVL